MIDIIQVPQANSILIDANDTKIVVQSTNENNYIEAAIQVDGALLFSQIWSLNEERKTAQNLKRLVHRLFDDTFTKLAAQTGITKVENIKVVTITLKERQVATQTITDQIELPAFKVLRSQNPVSLTVAGFMLLGNVAAMQLIAKGSGLRVPFYCDFTQQLSVSIKDAAGQVWYNKFYFEIEAGTHQLDFAAADIPDLAYFTIELDPKNGSEPLSVSYEQRKLQPYGFKELYYQNAYGFYLPGTLTGLKEVERGLSAQTYEDVDGQRITYEVIQDLNITLNSGYVNLDQNALIAAIAASVDVRMQYQGIYKRWSAETRKIQEFEDRRTDYDHTLIFNQIVNTPIENETGYLPTPQLVDVNVSTDQNQNIDIAKASLIAAYTGDAAPQRIRFTSPVTQGTLSIVKNGIKTIFFDAGTTLESSLPKTYLLSDIDTVRYEPDYNQAGTPAETIAFQMQDSGLWSVTANINITVNELAPGDLPPFIKLENFSVVIDENGDGSLLIPADITDPEGDPLTYLWEIVGTYAPASFDDAAIKQPTITLDGALLNDTFQIKVTATDVAASLSASKTVTVTAGNYAIVLNATYDAAESTPTSDFYDLELNGGQPGESVELRYVFFGQEIQQYAVIDPDEPFSKIIDGGNAIYVQDNDFSENVSNPGFSLPIQHRVQITDPNQAGNILVRVYVQNATGDQTIQTGVYEINI